jgi:hypothetical protein
MITLTVFAAALILAYYLADQLDKQEERERQRRIRARRRK